MSSNPERIGNKHNNRYFNQYFRLLVVVICLLRTYRIQFQLPASVVVNALCCGDAIVT